MKAKTIEDVIQVVKEQIPQANDNSPIFITGLSMGGFGALHLGAKYPSVFRAFSGKHSWDYWSEHIAETLLFFNQFV